MGWSPDGTRLLFSSDRTGAVGLWALTFADGKPKGAPELLRADIGPGISLGLTASGALYLYKNISSRDVKVAPIDLVQESSDRQAISFKDSSHAQPIHIGPQTADIWRIRHAAAIALRFVLWRQERCANCHALFCIRVALTGLRDGRSFIVAGRDKNGRNGIFRVDVQSGETTPVVTGPTFGSSPRDWSRDGLKIYYVNNGIVERDLATGGGTETHRRGCRSNDRSVAGRTQHRCEDTRG